ncbi:hypothetical protein OC66_11210 [Flavobacterium psychrophilum]|nr:hypothetical protein FPG1W08_10130 [Flavobacterium psychrophilum]ROO17265.1 hypothetical protein OC66_11210 [Flavobacterium psychrophilum]
MSQWHGFAPLRSSGAHSAIVRRLQRPVVFAPNLATAQVQKPLSRAFVGRKLYLKKKKAFLKRLVF